jgi:hypothetical protein
LSGVAGAIGDHGVASRPMSTDPASVLRLIILVLVILCCLGLVRVIILLNQAALVHKTTAAKQERLTRRLETTVERMERATGVVATNLEASIERADQEDSTVPGKSADAALRRGAE